MYEEIIEAVEASPVVMVGDYPYYISPLSNGVPFIDPQVLDQITDWMIRGGAGKCDMIFAPESMGIPYASVLSVKAGVPFSMIKKKTQWLPGEIAVQRSTGYSSDTIYVNAVRQGTDAVVVDDVISTGGTLIAVVKAMQNAGVNVTGIFTVFDKNRGAELVEQKTGVPTRALFDICIVDMKVCCRLSDKI